MSETTTGISRRTLFSGAAFGLVALGAGGSLAGCSGGGTAATISDTVAALPTYVPITKGPKPDLPGNDKVQPVYYSYPEDSELFRSVTRDVKVGGTTTGFVVTYAAPPPANNSFLDYIGDVTDTRYDLTFVPGDSFDTKFATMTAGNDIPNIVEFLTFAMPPRFPQLLDAKFSDLSEYLSGDAVKEYPNLANIPTASWRSARINGKIYGVPEHRPPFGSVMICRPDLIEQYTGAEPAPKDKDEFFELCKAVTDAKAGRYAIAGGGGSSGVDWSYDFIGATFGVPNQWAKSDGQARPQERDRGLARDAELHQEASGTPASSTRTPRAWRAPRRRPTSTTAPCSCTSTASPRCSTSPCRRGSSRAASCRSERTAARARTTRAPRASRSRRSRRPRRSASRPNSG
ncbi:extracellular solute-binding protein [Curtobacterium flaccumfaciens]|nr:extracellular solute-binding protein [Curtobacterium flaccumfaciens]